MFDGIARRYDALNHLLSAGLDRRWRRIAVDALRLAPGETLLDVCTGTADLAIAAVPPVCETRQGKGRVVGIDFSREMLAIARGKLGRRALSNVVTLMRADAMTIPIRSASVDAAAVAFGIRNVETPRAACAEMFRVLRRGGRLAILEFALPRTPIVRQLYRWYFTTVLPRVGRLVSRHADAYSYLPASVQTFQSPESFAALLEHVGFAEVRAVPLTFGVVYLYTASKA